MNDKTLHFLKKRFQDYYQDANIHLPPEYYSREWGFILFDDMPKTVMRRHMAFGSPGELQDYLTWRVPAHAYYSVAYYEYPSAPNMKDKNWIQSDLIFDLDADHLPNVPDSYSDMLENVKQEALKLYDFLSDDFGFEEDDINIVFSGGRGYHFHISHPSVRALGSAERREIVDYISGRGLETSEFYKKQFLVDGDQGAGTSSRSDAKKTRHIWTLKSYDGGWGKRIANYIVDYLEQESEKNDKEMFKDLRQIEGVGKKTLQEMKRVALNDNDLDKIRNKGQLDFGKISKFKDIMDYFIRQSIDNNSIDLISAQVDEPVTADIKRLIRVPGSLHGGSGLKVTVLSASQLEDFEPLDDAIVFGDNPITLNVTQQSTIEMKGNEFHVDEGVQELPEYAAIYLMCRGGAEYGPD